MGVGLVRNTKLKDSWRLLPSSAPFSLAAECISMHSILILPPDLDSSIADAGKLLQGIRRIRQYFSHSAFIQDMLIKQLDKRSLQNISFVQLPEDVVPHAIEMLPFDSQQLHIIKT